ncbi:hypothetical protein [Lysinibacter sp. HNR]|uniref:hypothetical protein n=1 Tax=Lysinibacter sp. HNR TaxID=3031408 RepID=UPI002435A91C|nr:hypothetical protein [Lysinibacter sp. HNR]WGD38465.1 hypothetical protein FrondiHNR_06030 [Lysinibacter sp. HNR]
MPDSKPLGHVVTLGDIYKQGQQTERRLDRLEAAVESLARVDERMDAHSARIRALETRITEQARDTEDIDHLRQALTDQAEETRRLSALVHRMAWMPVAGMAIITSVGGVIITRVLS